MRTIEERLGVVERLFARGGGPPYDPQMESRVSRLEAIIPTLATRADMHQEFNTQTWRIAGILGVVVAATVALSKLV